MGWGFGWIAAGLVFLANPLVNVIDILPDAIGWLFMVIGLTRFSYMREDMAAVRHKALILTAVSVLKLLPMAWSLGGASRYPLAAEPTMVLTYTFVFSVLELIYGIPVMTELFRILASAGPLDDTRRAVKKSGALPGRAVRFLILRAVCSILPELVYLRSTEYLGDVIYGVVIDIRDYRKYLVVFFAVIAGVAGFVFLIRCLSFLRCAAKNENYRAALDVLAGARAEEMRCRSILERFVLIFVFFMIGAVFFCHVSVESISFLPDAAGVLFSWIAVLLMKKFIRIPKGFLLGTVPVFLLTLAYDGYSMYHEYYHHDLWTDSLGDYFSRYGTLHAEKSGELFPQLWFLGATVLITVVLIFWFRSLTENIQALDKLSTADGVALYDSMTKGMMRSEEEKYEKQPKTVLLWFSISFGFEIIRNLPVFAFVVTPIMLVGLIVNGIFLVKMYQWLAAKYKVEQYHFRYNAEKDKTTEE
ncbi:MAG: hypothetical protein MJ175_02735 [Clostridia bacterium]|nr:hypothetical protein [Clostridia bacterium]